jgi:hypothetical protein
MTTNTIILTIRDPSIFSSGLGFQSVKEGIIGFILDSPLLCSSDEPEDEIQCISIPPNTTQRPLRVSVTMFDIRNAQSLLNYCHSPVVKAEYGLEDAVCDHNGGSNRSIIIPRTPSFSIDSVLSRFSSFGQIEKIWFTDDASITIDFLDSRAPMRVRQFIESPQTTDQPASISFPTNDQLSGILTGIY